MPILIKPLTSDLTDDLARLFATDASANTCWCMWFITPVKDFHRHGQAGNRADFCDMLTTSEQPLGLLAYLDGEPVGWCAVGPRSRYVRALKTPTYRDAVADREANIWLVPCFFIHKTARGRGVTHALLEATVNLATANGAIAIDSFPFSTTAKRATGELQVGFGSVFAACGFEVLYTPSANRVVMRRTLNA